MTMVAERIGTLSVHKMHPAIGAEIRGVDLSRPLDAETVRQIKDAWHQHAVLVFRDQNLTEDDQRRFASHFGPVAKRVPPPKGAIKVETVDWDDMMMITDHVDARRQADRLARPRRDVFPHRQVLSPPPASRDVPLRHRDSVRRRAHAVLQHVRRLRQGVGRS